MANKYEVLMTLAHKTRDPVDRFLPHEVDRLRSSCWVAAMARNESDREDLLREATALVERVELQLAERDQPVVIGFRRNGSASVFFGADPVYQFNTDCQLRRAYCDGRLIKAEGGKLSSLTRERRDGEVQLIRHDLTQEESHQLLEDAMGHLSGLKRQLTASQYTIVGQVPADGAVVEKAIGFLDALSQPIPVAATPRVS